MSRTRQTLLLLGLGTLGLLGLAAMAAGQVDTQAARKQYDLKVKQLAADAGAQEHYALAKWCLKNNLPAETLSHALDAHKQSPDDVRVKYLIYILGGTALPPAGDATAAVPVVAPLVGTRKSGSLSSEQIDAIIGREDIKQIRGFRSIQRLLVAKCANAKCHGGMGTGAKWVLVLQGRTDDRQLAENFQIVQKYFNRENPDESVFLTKPLTGSEAGHPVKAIRGKTESIYQETVKYIKGLKTQADMIWDNAKK